MCICVYVCMCVYDGFYTALQSNRSTVCREKGIVPITRISIIHQDNFHDGEEGSAWSFACDNYDRVFVRCEICLTGLVVGEIQGVK